MRGQSHFDPASKALFKPKDAFYVRLSNLGMVLGLAAVAAATHAYGFGTVFCVYLLHRVGLAGPRAVPLTSTPALARSGTWQWHRSGER